MVSLHLPTGADVYKSKGLLGMEVPANKTSWGGDDAPKLLSHVFKRPVLLTSN